MVIKTLVEKLDSSCEHQSLQQSVRDQIQRIISTRMYLGDTPLANSWVTGFGVPEIVDEYSHTGDAHTHYRELLRRKILEFEPRLIDVKVKNVNSYSDRASCQLVLQLEECELEEQFFF
jgi:predicted component of type VI protein secretion system